LLSFLGLSRELMTVKLKDFVGKSGGANGLLFRGAKNTPEMAARIELRSRDELWKYMFRLAFAADDTLIFAEERVQSPGQSPQGAPVLSDLGSGHRESRIEPPSQGQSEVWDLLRHCRVYHVDDTSKTARLRLPAKIDDNRWLDPGAGNLAAVLYRLKRVQPREYQRIVETIQQIVPWFDDFELEPSELDSEWVLLNWREKGSDLLFGPHQLSDGTLRAMALVTLLLQPEKYLPKVIILDEPELGLHPVAMTIAAGLIQAAAFHAQVIVATQSVAFLNHFDPEDVVVVERGDGASVFRRLDSASLADWLEDYSLGELWEKNVIGGGPFA
jgi:predicted ATPase